MATKSVEVHYGVELTFKDGHKEVAWWWGQPYGFINWYEGIDSSYHPNLVTKAIVTKDTTTKIDLPETI